MFDHLQEVFRKFGHLQEPHNKYFLKRTFCRSWAVVQRQVSLTLSVDSKLKTNFSKSLFVNLKYFLINLA